MDEQQTNRGHFPGLSATAWLWVSLLLLAAAALRVAGLPGDMPLIYHPDEPVNLRVIQDMLRNGTANPKVFSYASLFYYLHVPGQALVWAVTGKLVPFLWQAPGSGIALQPEAFLIARALTALFGVGIVAATLVLARDVGLRGPGILFAGALAAINPLLSAHSRMISPDIPAAFFCVLAVIGAVRVLKTGGLPAYVFAAVMTGLAASVKYNAGLVGLAIAAAHLARHRAGLTKLHLLLLAGVISIAAFFLTSPYMLRDWPRASAGILAEINHYRMGHPGHEGSTLRFNLMWLWGAFGASLGLLAFTVRHPSGRLLLPVAVAVVTYFALISAQFVRFDRNLMPLLAPLIVLIAAGFEVLLGLLRRWLPQWGRSAAAIALAVVLLVPGAIQSLAEVTARNTDRRQEVRAWLKDNLAPGAAVFVDSYAPYLDPAAYRISPTFLALREPLDKLLAADVIVLSREGSGRFLRDNKEAEIATFRTIEARACERREFRNDGVTDFWVFRLRC